MSKHWQNVELSYLKKHGAKKSLENLAKRFGCDVDEVREKLEEINPNLSGVRRDEDAIKAFEVGLGLLSEERWGDALAAFEGLLEDGAGPVAARARQYVAIARQRAEADQETDIYAKAVFHKNRKEYQQVLEICDDNADRDDRFAYLKATVHLKLEEFEESVKWLEKAIALNPRNRWLSKLDTGFLPLKEQEEYADLFAE